MYNLVMNILLFTLFVGMFGFAIYVKFIDKSNTRERFAFYAVGSMTSLGTLAIKSLTHNESIWGSMENIAGVIAGKASLPVAAPPWTDHALIVVVFISCCCYIT